MSSRYHRLLIYDIKRTTKIDGMGPFNRPILELYTLNLPTHCGKVAINSIRGNIDKSKAEKMNIPICIPTFI